MSWQNFFKKINLYFKKKKIEYLFQTGLTNIENDRPVKASGYGKKLIAIQPDFSGGYDICATALEKINKPDESYEILKTAVSKCPHSYILWEKFAIACSQRNEFDNALEAIQKAIETEPSVSSLYYNKAIIFAKLGKYKDALLTLEYLINSVSDDFFDGYVLQSQILNSLKKPEIALERMKILEKSDLGRFGVSDLDTLNKKIYLTLADSYHLLNDEENEKIWIEKAKTL